jgi:hypothetical protein
MKIASAYQRIEEVKGLIIFPNFFIHVCNSHQDFSHVCQATYEH